MVHRMMAVLRSKEDSWVVQVIYVHEFGCAAPAWRRSRSQCGYWNSVVVTVVSAAL